MINYEPGDNIKFQVMDYDKKGCSCLLGSQCSVKPYLGPESDRG